MNTMLLLLMNNPVNPFNECLLESIDQYLYLYIAVH